MTIDASTTIDTAAADRLAASAPELTFWQAWRARVRFRYSARQRASFYSWLATLRARGLRLDVALATIYYIDTNNGENRASPLARAIPGWVAGMKLDGEPIDRLLRGWVSPSEHMVLSALTKTGLNAGSLAQLAKTAKSGQNLTRSLVSVSAQVYLTFAASIAIAFVMASILPDLLLGVPERYFTQNILVLQSTGVILTNYGHLVLAVMLALPPAVMYALPNLTGRWRNRIDRWPIFQQYRDIQGAVMLRAVATLIASGKSFFEALELLRDVASPYLAYHIAAILEHRSSRPYAAMRETGLEFPNATTITTLAVVMEGPDPDKALLDFSEEWQDFTEQLIDDAGKAFLAVFRGVVYGLAIWLILTFNDIYSLYDKIQ